jgi:hypothetical protein
MPDPLAWMNNVILGTGTCTPVRPYAPTATMPTGPLTSQVATANVAVTVFAAGTIQNVADIVNPLTATETLYVDIVGSAVCGAPTSIPLAPGQAYRVSAPIKSAVTVVAATAGHGFNAVMY